MPSTSSPPSRASVWEWAQALLLAANLAWTTLCLGGYRAETVAVTSALTGALLAVHFLARALAGETPRAHPAGWWLLPFVGCALCNVFWIAPARWLAWLDWFGWAQMAAVFWVVVNGVRRRGPQSVLFLTLVALALLGVLLGCYQRFVDSSWLMLGRTQALQFAGRASGSFGIPNSFAALLLLVGPVVGALAFRRRATPLARIWWGWVTLVLAIGLLLTISRGAWLALALALTAWPLFSRRWRWQRRVAAALVVVCASAAVIGVVYAASPKVRERIAKAVHDSGELSRPILWRAAWKLFRDAPAFGTGAGSYNVLFERHRPERFPEEPQWAHNDYLNTLSDHGAVGFGLLVGGCLAIAATAWRGARVAAEHARRERELARTRPADPFRVPAPRHWFDSSAITAALGIGLLAFALQLFVEFHFHLPALALAFATLAGLLVSRTTPPDRAAPRPAPPAARALAGLLGLGAAAAIALFFVPLFRAEGLRARARETLDQLARETTEAAKPLDRVRLQAARNQLDAALRRDPRNGQAWSDLAHAIALAATLTPGDEAARGREAEAAAQRALERSAVHAEFWVRRAVARDLQGRWLEAGNDTARALALAPASSNVWYYHAFHLSRNPAERGLAQAAVAFCLRLDPWNSAGLALRQFLAISPKAP